MSFPRSNRSIYGAFEFREKIINYSKKGNLEMIIKLFGEEMLECIRLARFNKEIQIPAFYKILFANSCYNNQLHIVRWILETQQINIPIEHICYTFSRMCYQGNEDIIEYILARYANDIMLRDFELVFAGCCHYGSLHMAKRLLEVKPEINISYNKEMAFINACRKGHLDIVNWLLDVKPNINVTANYNEAFTSACINGFAEIAKLLTRLKPCYYLLELNEDGSDIVKYSVRCKADRKWLERSLPLMSNRFDSNSKFSDVYMPFDVVKMICEFV